MPSISGIPQLYLPGEFSGEILIAVPVKNTGPACDAVVNLYIHEGSWMGSHGALLAAYGQEVRFEEEEQKEVVFAHMVIPTGQSRRDIGIEVVVGDSVEASAEFDDVYHVAAAPGLVENMMSIMMMGMMMMVMSSIMPAGA